MLVYSEASPEQRRFTLLQPDKISKSFPGKYQAKEFQEFEKRVHDIWRHPIDALVGHE